MRSFLFLCTIWKLAYISAATSPSRISLSLQLTISSPKVTLFVGWRGVPPHYHATKPKGKPQTNKTHGSQLRIIFLWFFSQPLRSKTKTNTERHKNIWDAFFLNQVYQQNNEEGTWSVGRRLPRLLQTQPHGEGLELWTWACMTILNVLKCLPQLPLMV